MLGQFRRLFQPARASRSTRPELAVTAIRALHTATSTGSDENPQHLTDPYLYTTGRWLNHDKLYREARHVKFDFAALCGKVVNVSTGATKVVRYEKKEGGFNRVFLMYLDNGARVVARVPYRIAGPQRLTTNSEVATMAYIRSFTKIPVPKVLDWSDDKSSVGTEYIIMEHALGVQLHDKWPSMSPIQHMECVEKVAFMITEMAKLPFPVYGSLYFADAPLDPNLKFDFVEGTNLQSYCSSLIDAGFSRIPKVDHAKEEPSYRGSVKEHLRLLDISNRVIQELIKSSIIENVAGPILLHPDIHKRNIYVSEEDPSCVTAIIDWQSTSIEPAFAYAHQTPDLAEDPTADIPVLEKLMFSEGEPSHAEAPKGTSPKNPEEEAARKKYEKDVLICRQTFEVILLGNMRKLHDARAMDQTLLRPIQYCDASWRYSAAALRQELIDLSQRWTALGLSGSCPYQPTPEELAEHAKQYEDFETVQQLKLFLKRALDADSDGWVPADQWVAAKRQATELYDHWVESVKEKGGSEDRARDLWPFNEVSSPQEGQMDISNSA